MLFYNIMAEEWKTSFIGEIVEFVDESSKIYFNSLCDFERTRNFKGSYTTGKRAKQRTYK
jgi:hypothetical protein